MSLLNFLFDYLTFKEYTITTIIEQDNLQIAKFKRTEWFTARGLLKYRAKLEKYEEI